VDLKVKLRVQGLTSSQLQSGTYALILAEEKGTRRVPIIVGMSEAQAIAIALERIAPPRPLTHDLFPNLLIAFDVRLLEVYIYKFEEGIFFSELLFERKGLQCRIDSRTSDAIAIALRVKCDIYADEKIMKECGIEPDEIRMPEDEDDDEDDEEDVYNLEPEDIKDEQQMKKWLSTLDDDELESRLEDAIVNENYEHAKMCKDELHRREREGGKEK
jgi:bifunctional DNase/RNase